MIELQLFHGSIEVGNIIQSTSEFPNLLGEIELTFNVKENIDILNYTKYSIKLNELFLIDEGLSLEYIENEEYNHLQLINSNNWYLLNQKKEVINILVPIFDLNDRITWRYK